MPLVRIVLEDQAVVLVREQEVLAPAAGSHDDNRISDRRGAPAVVVHFRLDGADHPAIEVVVDMGQQGLNLVRREMIGEHLFGQLDLRRLDFLQAVPGPLVGQAVDLAHLTVRRVRHRIVHVEHADQTPGIRIGHRHVPNVQAAHGGDRPVKVVGGDDALNRRGHDLAYRCLDGYRKSHSAGDVLFGQQALGPALGVDDDRGRRPRGGQAIDDGTARGRSIDNDRRGPHEISHQFGEDCGLGAGGDACGRPRGDSDQRHGLPRRIGTDQGGTVLLDLENGHFFLLFCSAPSVQ